MSGCTFTKRSPEVPLLARERTPRNRAAALYRASGERHGQKLELDQVLVFHIEDGLVRNVLALPSDPAAFAAFWA